MLQLSFNNNELDRSVPPRRRAARKSSRTLVELKRGERGIVDRLELPDDVARRLMELGFVPGHVVAPALSAPGGDPRVFRVDGSEVALRRDTAAKIFIRPVPE